MIAWPLGTGASRDYALAFSESSEYLTIGMCMHEYQL